MRRDEGGRGIFAAQGTQIISLKNFTELSDDEAIEVLGWRNEESVRSNFFDSSIITQDKHLSFVKSLSTTTSRRQFLAIKDNEKIGVVYLTKINSSESEYELGIYTNPFSGTKNKGSLIMGKILDECKKLNITTIRLNVFKTNERAICLYKKFGFCTIQEKDGVILMSLSL